MPVFKVQQTVFLWIKFYKKVMEEHNICDLETSKVQEK